MNKNIYIIVPVFNEAEVIATTVSDLLMKGFTIVVVDDASSDNTAEIIKSLPVYYLKHNINLGQGAALQTGITFAQDKGADIFVTFDADGQHRSADIKPMIDKLVTEELDIIFGSRFLGKNISGGLVSRKLVLHFARYFNFLLTGILLTDAHNGLRVFNRKTATAIRILENRMAHATEFLIIVKKHKLKYGEEAVYINYTPYSRKKGQKNLHGFKIIQDILLYKFFK